jgi:hypothetical protein
MVIKLDTHWAEAPAMRAATATILNCILKIFCFGELKWYNGDGNFNVERSLIAMKMGIFVEMQQVMMMKKDGIKTSGCVRYLNL